MGRATNEGLYAHGSVMGMRLPYDDQGVNYGGGNVLNPDGTINRWAFNQGDKYYGEKLQAALIRAQYADFLGRYQPWAQGQVDKLLDPEAMGKEIGKADVSATESFANIRGQRTRRLGRYGISADPDPNQSLNEASARVSVANETRSRFMERQNRIITGSAGALNTVAATAAGYGGS